MRREWIKIHKKGGGRSRRRDLNQIFHMQNTACTETFTSKKKNKQKIEPEGKQKQIDA